MLKKPQNGNGIWLLTEITERKRRIPRKNHFYNVGSIEDHMGTSQVYHEENHQNAYVLSLNMEGLNLLNDSMNYET